VSSDDAKRAGAGRKFSWRLYLLAFFLLIVLPLAGYSVSSWLTGIKPAVDSYFLKPAREFRGLPDIALALAFSPDGRRALTGDHGNGMLRLWDIATGRCIRTMWAYSGPEPRPRDREMDQGGPNVSYVAKPVGAVAFSPDSRRALSGNDNGEVMLWDLESGRRLRTLKGHRKDIVADDFCPGGRRALSGGGDGTIRRWDLDTGKCQLTPVSHEGWVRSVAFSPDCRRALTGSDGTVRLWDLETCERLLVLGKSDCAAVVAFSPDGRRARTVGHGDDTVRLWDLGTGECLHALKEGWDVGARTVAFSPDGRRCVLGTSYGIISLHDTATGQEIGRFIRPDHSFRTATFSPDGRYILAGSDAYDDARGERELLLWRGPTDLELRVWRRFGGELPDPVAIARAAAAEE